MRVFLTGGTGSIGHAVLECLLAHGHFVTCAVKDEAAQTSLQTSFAGNPSFSAVHCALSVSGGPMLTSLATGYDAIIHTAQSFTEEGQLIEEATLRAFVAAGRATAEQGKPCHFTATSTLWVLGETGDTEVDELGSTETPYRFAAWRVPMERLVLEAANSSIGFTTAVVRPSWVYGTSYVDRYIRISKEREQIIIPSANKHYETIHKDDLAELYRLVMEQRATGPFNGCEIHSVALEDLVAKMQELGGVREIIRVDNPMAYVKDLGFFIVGLTVNQRVAPRRSLEIGWQPKHAFLESFAHLFARSLS